MALKGPDALAVQSNIGAATKTNPSGTQKGESNPVKKLGNAFALIK